jgi:hypothetical protein
MGSLALASCSFQPGPFMPGTVSDDAFVDMQVTDDAGIDAFVLGAWATPTALSLTGDGFDDDPTLTDDMLEMYFNRSNDIYVTTRTSLSGAWSDPQLVDALSGASELETTPEIVSDGTTIFIASDASGTEGSTDIWVSTRASRNAEWPQPTRVPELSETAGDGGSAPTDDLRTIVLTSDRTGGAGFSDIYLSERAQNTDAWTEPVNLSTVNSGNNDYSPMLSPDKRTLWFNSTRSGSDDLYVATRTSTTAMFGDPAPITELNSSVASESDMWVSPDQRHMFFVRSGVIHETSR